MAKKQEPGTKRVVDVMPGDRDWVVERELAYPEPISFKLLADEIMRLDEDKKPGRWSAYFGHVLGGKTCRVEDGFNSISNGRGFRFGDRWYAVNSPKIATRRTSPHSMLEMMNNVKNGLAHRNKVTDFMFRVCAVSLKALRAELPPSEAHEPGLWQCNVNLYSGSNTLQWHRDDRDRIEDGEAYASNHTFLPVSATYIVKSSADDPGCGLDVAFPTEKDAAAADKLPLRHHKDTGVVSCGLKPDALATYQVYTANPTANSKILTILKEGAYSHGLHTFNSGKLARNTERLTFNFRLVRQRAWDDMMWGATQHREAEQRAAATADS